MAGRDFLDARQAPNVIPATTFSGNALVKSGDGASIIWDRL
jgi:hypothetical protein